MSERIRAIRPIPETKHHRRLQPGDFLDLKALPKKLVEQYLDDDLAARLPEPVKKGSKEGDDGR